MKCIEKRRVRRGAGAVWRFWGVGSERCLRGRPCTSGLDPWINRGAFCNHVLRWCFKGLLVGARLGNVNVCTPPILPVTAVCVLEGG